MYSSFSPHSSIWFFPPGLKDICSPPSQVITHLKQWPFLHPLNNPHHFENSAYVSNFSTPYIVPYPSSLPASLVCQSPSVFPLSTAVPFIMLCPDLFGVRALSRAETMLNKGWIESTRGLNEHSPPSQVQKTQWMSEDWKTVGQDDRGLKRVYFLLKTREGRSGLDFHSSVAYSPWISSSNAQM